MTSEDWDYQDFPPDLRCALLDSAITNDVTDESNPEANALSQILHDAKGVAWVGLTREAALDDWVCHASEMNGSAAAASSLGFEAKVVLLCTPIGGIQGQPDGDSLARFMEKVPQMDPMRLAQAVLQRLQDPASCWQIRSKTVVLLQTLLESKVWVSVYLPVLSSFSPLMQQLETMRTSEHNPIPREQARKVLSLIQSNGTDSTLMTKQTVVSPKATRSHIKREKRVSPTSKKQPKPVSPDATTYSRRQGSAQPPPAIQTQGKTFKLINNSQKKGDPAEIQPLTSPKIAKAAMASWRRRNSIETKMQANLLPMTEAMAKNPQFRNAHAVWISNSPRRGNSSKRASIGTTKEPMQSSIQAAEPTNSRYNSGQLSSFSFMH